MTVPITRFREDYFFLSNFFPAPVTFDGLVYPTNEHAYQAAKSLDFKVRQDIALLATPKEAKRAGKGIELRSDWSWMRLVVMWNVLKSKFSNKELAARLVATGDALIVEGNDWGDCYWGVCNGVGENWLGRLLMKLRDELRAKRSRTIAEIEESGGYEVIYLDFPLDYDNKGRGAAANHYITEIDARIRTFPLRRLSAKNSVLFLWATWPKLPVCLDAMRIWGFDYKTCGFVWFKHYERKGKMSEKIFQGNGFWTRSNTEMVLIGVRGDLRRLDTTDGRSVHQVIESFVEEDDLGEPREERVIRIQHPHEGKKIKHSAKPREVRDRIVQLMGNRSYLEMFARERAEGWHSHGNEVPGGSDVDLTVS